eukprot:7054914-Prorocentrum_lima.AAC.1
MNPYPCIPCWDPVGRLCTCMSCLCIALRCVVRKYHEGRQQRRERGRGGEADCQRDRQRR